jgi:hypothetical protein
MSSMTNRDPGSQLGTSREFPTVRPDGQVLSQIRVGLQTAIDREIRAAQISRIRPSPNLPSRSVSVPAAQCLLVKPGRRLPSQINVSTDDCSPTTRRKLR